MIFKILFYLILFYYIIILIRILIPFLLNYFLKKIIKNQMNNKSKEPIKKRKVGDIIIEEKKKNSKIKKTEIDSEYIDFEEID